MKLGAALPHSGVDASPDGMVAFAHRAEEHPADDVSRGQLASGPANPAG
jgi:hypothetical protein